MSLKVRVAKGAEQDRCLEMIGALTGQASSSQGWIKTFQALLSGERGDVLVADDSGTLLGVVTVSYNLAIRYAGEYAQLEELIVDPVARGRNVGGLLVEAAVARARDRGCAELGLYLLETTERNRPFYEKYGFEYVGSEMRQRL